MRTKVEDRHIKYLEDTNFYGNNFIILTSRIIFSNMSLEDDLGDINSKKNVRKLKNCYLAFTKLFNSPELTKEVIIETANLINRASMYISDGYRHYGDKLNGDANIPISQPEDVERDMEMLLYNYNNVWDKLDPFEREALFNIEFLRIHPFEDGNGRTSRLILNYNMIRQGYAPIILNGEDRDMYFAARNRTDTKYIRDLFEIKSAEELSIIEELIEEYESEGVKVNEKRKGSNFS